MFCSGFCSLFSPAIVRPWGRMLLRHLQIFTFLVCMQFMGEPGGVYALSAFEGSELHRPHGCASVRSRFSKVVHAEVPHVWASFIVGRSSTVNRRPRFDYYVFLFRQLSSWARFDLYFPVQLQKIPPPENARNCWRASRECAKSAPPPFPGGMSCPLSLHYRPISVMFLSITGEDKGKDSFATTWK